MKDFNNFLGNCCNKEVGSMDFGDKELCIHDYPKNECAICNNRFTRTEPEEEIAYQKSRNHPRALFRKIRELQKQSLIFASKHNQPYKDEELKFFIRATDGVDRNNLEILFEVAKQLSRRFHAIDWLWKFTWDNAYKDRFIIRHKTLINRIDKLKIEERRNYETIKLED